jgi:hypothetical protein
MQIQQKEIKEEKNIESILQSNSKTDRIEYKLKYAIVSKEVRKINRKRCCLHVGDPKYEVRGRQDEAYKANTELDKSERDTLSLKPTTLHQW